MLRGYSGSGVAGRARAGGGAGRASCLGEGTRGGRSPGAGLESAAPAAACPAGAAAPCSARPGTAGAMDRGRGKRSRGARTGPCAGRGGGTAVQGPERKRRRERAGGAEEGSERAPARGRGWEARARVDRCLLPPGQLGCRLVPRVPGPSALLCGRPVPHAQSQLQERMPRRIPEDSELLPPRAPLEG